MSKSSSAPNPKVTLRAVALALREALPAAERLEGITKKLNQSLGSGVAIG